MIRQRREEHGVITKTANKVETRIIMDVIMDIGTLGEEASLELARELLIAISYSEPDKVLNSVASENLNGADGVLVTNGDEAEEARSELISISYIQSPDVEVLPVAMGTPEG